MATRSAVRRRRYPSPLALCVGTLAFAAFAALGGSVAAAPSSRTSVRRRQQVGVRGGCSSSPSSPWGGGSSPLEPNPAYRGSGAADRPMTLGDLEEGYVAGRQQRSADRHYGHQSHQFASSSSSQRPRPMVEVIGEFFASLKRLSPTLYYTSASVIAIFLLWQVPVQRLRRSLNDHFVCNRENVIRRRRVHAAVLSAVSHSSATHVLMNLYGLFMFGPPVRRSIASAGLPLWPFALGSALSGSALFLALSPHGGCLGLSGVTLAMLAYFARANPSSELGFVIRLVPVRMPAEYALTGIFVVSLLGVLSKGSRDGVAHAAHLGGLAFGAAYFELLSRGWLTYNRPWFCRWNDMKRVFSVGG